MNRRQQRKRRWEREPIRVYLRNLRFLGLWSFVLFVAFCSICSSALAVPKIEVVGVSSIDFGQYPAWERKVARYTIRNSGDEPLKIFKVRKTCGCASATIDKKELDPKETATVEVVILPNTIFYLYSKNTFVESNDPDNRFARLNVSGNAIPLFDVGPKTEVNAGRIRTKQPWSYSFSLESTRRGVRLGEPVVKSNYPINVRLTQAAEGSKQYQLAVTMPATTNSGDLMCAISISVIIPEPDKDKPVDQWSVPTNQPPIALSLTGKIGADLNVVPGIAHLSLSDEPVSRKFTLNVLGQRSRELNPGELLLPEQEGITYGVKQDDRKRGLLVTVTFDPEFLKTLYAEEVIPLSFTVPGASSATVVCKIRK